ncbi:hypothetical protein AeRB84_006148 [Aphanomyces euteiches]|nr:hypothetical protein AeRB84_006148 [Aphanomyces euteiches]
MLRSIGHFDVAYFTWKDLNLRKKVIAAAFGHGSLEEWFVHDFRLSYLRFVASFSIFGGNVSVKFCGTEEFVNYNANLEIMRALVSPLEAPRPENIRNLLITLSKTPAFRPVWSTVLQLLQSTRVQVSEVSRAVLILDDVVLLTDGIRDHSML